MKISVIGTGYVGLVTGACFAEKGHDVVCVDIPPEIVDSINKGIPTIHEPGLEELLRRNVGSRLRATTDLVAAVRESEISFLCVGTPSAQDGSIDLSYLRQASREVGRALGQEKGKGVRHTVVVKSTVVPGTTLDVVAPTIAEESGLAFPEGFGVCSNPEFLREGNAVEDALRPDRIVVGAEDEESGRLLARVYEGRFDAPVFRTNTRTAEMIKYANNSLLSTLISFSNEIADICESVPDVDVQDVLSAVTLDGRINPRNADGSLSNPQIISYLRAGCGFGGSCFPKDVAALINYSRVKGHSATLLESVMSINRQRAAVIVERLRGAGRTLRGKRVAILGTAFKPDTDDIRESPALGLIDLLLAEGADVVVTDPQALENTRKLYSDRIRYFTEPTDALKGSDIAVLVTRWKEFASVGPEDFARLMNPGALLFDGRRLYDRKRYSQASFRYEGIGFGGVG